MRKRVTRGYDILPGQAATRTTALFDSIVLLPWGTADETYPQCRLIKQDEFGQVDNPAKSPNDPPAKLVRVFEELDRTNETPVGQATVDVTLDGVTTVTQESLQFSRAVSGITPVYQTPGTQTAPAPWTSAILIDEKRTDDGDLQHITRIYLLPGLISAVTSYEISPDQGTTGITRLTLKYVTGSSSTSNPFGPFVPGGYVLTNVGYDDSGGRRMWTGEYVFGQGIVDSSVEIRENGKLVIYSITSINAAPSAPSPTIGGTVVLIKSENRNGTRVENGTVVYEYQWAEGHGQVATHITTRQDGLREVTFVSLGTRVAPSGIIVRDDNQEETGYTLYTVSALQTAAGGADPSAVSFTFGAIEKFTYPGRLKSFISSANLRNALDVYKSPPLTTDIPASILITYQTSPTLTLAHTLWAPVDAATVIAQWVSNDQLQHSLVESFPGYRVVPSGSTSLLATTNLDASILNQPILAATVGFITATGGPASPDGNTYALSGRLEPAFTDTTGTMWYRKTEIFATIPTQPALPV